MSTSDSAGGLDKKHGKGRNLHHTASEPSLKSIGRSIARSAADLLVSVGGGSKGSRQGSTSRSRSRDPSREASDAGDRPDGQGVVQFMRAPVNAPIPPFAHSLISPNPAIPTISMDPTGKYSSAGVGAIDLSYPLVGRLDGVPTMTLNEALSLGFWNNIAQHVGRCLLVVSDEAIATYVNPKPRTPGEHGDLTYSPLGTSTGSATFFCRCQNPKHIDLELDCVLRPLDLQVQVNLGPILFQLEQRSMDRAAGIARECFRQFYEEYVRTGGGTATEGANNQC